MGSVIVTGASSTMPLDCGCGQSRCEMKNCFSRSSLFRAGVALALFGQSALFGCTSAMQRAAQHATDVCAAKGKQPFIVDSQVKDSFWHGETASLVALTPRIW
jgi:hypothetical protein